MWKPESDIPSFELCLQLEKEGFPQEGIWYWCYAYHDDKWLLEVSWNSETMLYNKRILAPTVGQLGEWLPQCETRDYRVSKYIGGKKHPAGWECHHESQTDRSLNPKEHYVTGATEADARAKMLLQLRRDGLIK